MVSRHSSPTQVRLPERFASAQAGVDFDPSITLLSNPMALSPDERLGPCEIQTRSRARGEVHVVLKRVEELERLVPAN